jgi:hypothetical protein
VTCGRHLLAGFEPPHDARSCAQASCALRGQRGRRQQHRAQQPGRRSSAEQLNAHSDLCYVSVCDFLLAFKTSEWGSTEWGPRTQHRTHAPTHRKKAHMWGRTWCVVGLEFEILT